MRSCPSVHGYSTKKSTAFCPVASKYGSQSLLHDHMMSHYQRIHNATAMVDTSTPKSREMYIINKMKSRSVAKNQKALMTDTWSMSTVPRPNSRIRPQVQNTDYPIPPEGAGYSMDDVKTRSTLKGSQMVPSLNFGRYGRESPLLNTYPMETERSSVRAHNAYIFDLQKEEKRLAISQSNSLDSWRSEQQNPIKSNATGYSSLHWQPEDYGVYPEFQLLKKKNDRLDDEQKYLDFLNDITDEVIKRGIYSNRVLMHVCRGHVEKRKHDLNEGRMWEMITQLKTDLNIEDEED